MKKQNKESILFIALCFTISWACWLPPAIAGFNSRLMLTAGTFGPIATAVIISIASGGPAQLKKLLRPLGYWRIPIGYYIFSLFSTAAAAGIAILIFLAAGGKKPEFNDPRKIYLVIPVFLYILFLSVAGEETGWRGFLQPRVQKHFAPLQTSILIGLIWGLWHLPLFLDKNNFHSGIPFSLFMIQIIFVSIIYTWLYNRTGGSLLMVHIFHAASNTTLGVLPVLPQDNSGNPAPLWLTVLMLAAVSLFLVFRNQMWRNNY